MKTLNTFVFIILVGLEFICSPSTASCPTSNYPGVQFTDVVVFSASFAVTGVANPSSSAPPTTALAADLSGKATCGGRNSNGPLYHEVLAFGDNLLPNYLNSTGGCTGSLLNAARIWNFAVNAASCDNVALYGRPDTILSILEQVGMAISKVVSNQDSTLYVFQVATTDIAYANLNPDNIPNIVSCYSTAINRTVAGLGGKYFLLANSYAYDFAPQNLGNSPSQKAALTSAIMTFNAQMAVTIPANFKQTSPSTVIWIVDLYGLYVNTLLSNATKYYGANADIVDQANSNFGNPNVTADSFFWYDSHHPSRATHRYIAQAMYDTLLAAPATTQLGLTDLSVSAGYLSPSFSPSTLSYTLHGIKKPGSSVLVKYNSYTSASVSWGSCSDSTCGTKLTSNILCYQTLQNPCPNGMFTITGVDVNQYYYVTSNSITLVISTPPAVAALKGDPHFRGFLDQDYTITGHPGSVYSILSSADISYNAKFIWYGDKYHGVDPVSNKDYDSNVTYIGEVGIRVRNPITQVEYRIGVSVPQEITADAASNNLLLNINGDNIAINKLTNFSVESCGGQCMIRESGMNKISIVLNDVYTITFEAKQTKHKNFFIDEELAVQDWNKLIQSKPHGLLGQTWMNKQTWHHARDEVWSGHKAGLDFMFKSADFLQGHLQDYVIQEHNVYGIHFTFNQYKL